MARFKLELIEDEQTGMFAVSVFYPADAVDPAATTGAIYPTEDAAVEDALAIFKKALPGQPVKVVE